MTSLAIPRFSWRDPLAALAVVSWAAAVGAALVYQPKIGLALGLVPIALLFLVRPEVAAVCAIGATPFVHDVIGSEYSNVNIDVADLIYYLVTIALIAPILLRTGVGTRLLDMRVPWLWALPFTAWLIVVLAAHWSFHGLFKTAHTYEIYLLPILVGAVVLDRRTALWACWLFIIAGCVLAIGWTANGGSQFLEQKNPSGQFITDALLLTLLIAKDWRARTPPIVILAIGVLFTGSRGALLGAALGGVAFLAIRGLGSWRRTAAAVVPLALAIVVGYNVVPQSLQQRLKTFSVGQATGAETAAGLSAAQYTINIRRAYRTDGLHVASNNAAFGVGTGNYVAGNPLQGTQTQDPHDMLIKVAAEQGVPGLVAFVVLMMGTAWSLLRRIRITPWAAAALVLQVAIVTHGLVDIYWVRGTPVLGWLLVGMAFNRRLRYDGDAAR